MNEGNIGLEFSLRLACLSVVIHGAGLTWSPPGTPVLSSPESVKRSISVLDERDGRKFSCTLALTIACLQAVAAARIFAVVHAGILTRILARICACIHARIDAGMYARVRKGMNALVATGHGGTMGSGELLHRGDMTTPPLPHRVP